MNRIVYLGYQWRHRDLDSRILLAIHLLINGHVVAIAHEKVLGALVDRLPCGVVVLTAADQERGEIAKRFRSHGFGAVLTDETALSASRASLWQKSTSACALQNCDVFLANTPHHRAVMLSTAPSANILMTGNVRCDLLSPAGRRVFENDATAIKRQCNYILLCPPAYPDDETRDQFVGLTHALLENRSERIFIYTDERTSIGYWKKLFLNPPTRIGFIEGGYLLEAYLLEAEWIVAGDPETGLAASMMGRRCLRFKRPSSGWHFEATVPEVLDGDEMVRVMEDAKGEYATNGVIPEDVRDYFSDELPLWNMRCLHGVSDAVTRVLVARGAVGSLNFASRGLNLSRPAFDTLRVSASDILKRMRHIAGVLGIGDELSVVTDDAHGVLLMVPKNGSRESS